MATQFPKTLIVGAVCMGLVLVVSNYLVQFPLGDWLTVAAFTYPIAFLVTDTVNRLSGAAIAAKVVAFGFVFGIPVSFLFNISTAESHWFDSGRIAIASGFAFAVAQMADILIFAKFRDHAAWWLPPLLSSAPASLLDTALFFSLAFWGTAVPWVTLSIGDILVKGAMVLFLLLPYRLLLQRLSVA